MNDYVAELKKALLAQDRLAVTTVLQNAMVTMKPVQFAEQVVVPTMEEIGNDWEAGTVALSQVFMGGRLCEEFVDTILPAADSGRISQPKMAIAVLQDYHVLGKRMVYSVLRASGFELTDFGSGISVEALATKAYESETKILLISTLMLNAALRIEELTAKFRADGKAIKVVVGGAPFKFDPNLWKNVGADAMGENSSEAIIAVKRIMEEMQ